MQDWTQDIAACAAEGRLGTVLHIGAGEATELPACLEAGADRVLLVEPDPQQIGTLRGPAARDPERVVPIEAALAVTTGRAPFQRLNLAAFSGLELPGALREIFPGLRVTATPEVDTLSPADLAARIAPDLEGEGGHLLLLDAPQVAELALHGLAEAGLLMRFDQLLLRVSDGPVWAGGGSAETLLEWLRGQGFAVVSQDRADPDFARVVLRLDRAAMATRKLSGENAELRRARDAAQAEIAALQASVEAETEAYEKHCAALEAELSELRGARDAGQAEIAALQASVEAETEAHETRRAALETELSEQRGEVGRLSGDLADRDARIATLEADRSERGQEAERLAAELAERDAQATRLTGDLETAQARVATLEAELSGRQDEVDRLTVSLSEREARVDGLSTDLEAAETRAAGFETERDDLAARLETAEAVTAARNERIGELEHQLGQARQAQADTAARIETLEAELTEAGTGRSAAEAEIETLKTRAGAREEWIAELDHGLKAARQAEQAARGELVEKARELTELQARRDEEARLTTQRMARIEELRDKLQTARGETQEARDALQRRTTEAEAAADRAAQESRAQADRVAALETALAELRAAHEGTQAETPRQQDEIAALRSQAEAAGSRADGADARLAEARRDLSLALRAQALGRSDLEDLQGRHMQLRAENAEMQALLEKLTTRLGEAAAFLDRVESEAPGVLAAQEAEPARAMEAPETEAETEAETPEIPPAEPARRRAGRKSAPGPAANSAARAGGKAPVKPGGKSGAKAATKPGARKKKAEP